MMFSKFEGEIVIHTKMMIDPNAKTRRGGGKHLGIRRGEILEVIEFTSKDEMLCRDPKGKCKCAWPTSRERRGARAENPLYSFSPVQMAMCPELHCCPCKCWSCLGGMGNTRVGLC